MNCEKIFCIYWQNQKCLLQSISIDTLGHCQDCIFIEIKEPKLEKKRAALRAELQQNEANWR